MYVLCLEHFRVGEAPTADCNACGIMCLEHFRVGGAPTADCNACRIMWTYSKYNDEFDNNLMDN